MQRGDAPFILLPHSKKDRERWEEKMKFLASAAAIDLLLSLLVVTIDSAVTAPPLL